MISLFLIHPGAVFLEEIAYFESNDEDFWWDRYYIEEKKYVTKNELVQRYENWGFIFKQGESFDKYWDNDSYKQIILSDKPIRFLTFDPFEDSKYRCYDAVYGKEKTNGTTIYVYLTNYKYTIHYIP